MRGRIALFSSIGICSLLLAGCRGSSELSLEQKIAKAQKAKEPDVRAKKLIQIAEDRFRARDLRGAESTMTLALRACGAVEDQADRAEVFAKLAEAQVELGTSDGRRAVESALEAVRRIEDPATKSRLLAKVGRTRGLVGDVDGAARTLSEAAGEARQLEDLAVKTLVLGRVATGYQKIGRQTEADRVIEEALGSASSIEDHQKRCEAITLLAADQHATEEAETALTSFNLAVEAAEKIENPYSHAYALTDVAEALAKAGHYDKTKELLNKAERIAEGISMTDEKERVTKRIKEVAGLKRKLAKS